MYASSAPDLLKFTDTDGDGKADKREVLLTGWVLNVNANSLIGPFMGPDGWLYMSSAIMGFDVKTKEGERFPWDFQLANAIDLLKRIAEIYEPHGIIMVMESMNPKIDHPNMFLHTLPQAYALAKAVKSSGIKVLFDFYHVQIQEGNLLPTLDYAWDEIAYIQVGDTPGRKEPTSGEINYWNVLKHVHDKGYRGFVWLEHGTSKPGEEGALSALEAYRKIDPTN